MIKAWLHKSLTLFHFPKFVIMYNNKRAASLSSQYLTLRTYCSFGFRENFIFAKSIKRHISDVKKSRLRQDLPLSINDRVILKFREGSIFTNFAYAKFRENNVLSKISEFTVSCTHCDLLNARTIHLRVTVFSFS